MNKNRRTTGAGKANLHGQRKGKNRETANKTLQKRGVFAALALLLVAGVVVTLCLTLGKKDEVQVGKGASLAATEYKYTGHSLRKAEITVKNYGVIQVVLDETVAPLTVANFISLAEQGFYDGLTFHRVMEGFMIQGGDPKGDGTGGPGYTISGEFSANGIENDLRHLRGVLSMARANGYDTGGSQFFIMQETSPWLDGKYAAFGWVTAGMSIVDDIAKKTPVTDRNGTVRTEKQPIITSIRILPKEDTP